ncbi:hypothetical protein [Actinophytocola sp. KF-1]
MSQLSPGRTTAFIGVALVFASGMAINQLSELVKPHPIFVVSSSVFIFAAMIVFERAREPGGLNGLRVAAGLGGFVRWAIASILVGIALSAPWLLPFIPDVYFDVPRRFVEERSVYSLRELAGAGCITVVASAAAIRRRASVVDVAIFVTFAVTGFTFVQAWYPRQLVFAKFDLMGTFVGWLIFVAALTTLIGILPHIVGLLGRFLGIGSRSAESTQSEGNDRA